MAKEPVMTLPTKPQISEAYIVRHKGNLKGPITPGEVFAWEPDEPYARELTIVAVARDGIVWSWDMKYTKCVLNDEDRFREACHRTRFQLFPVKTPPQLEGEDK